MVLKFQCRDIKGKWYSNLSTNLSREGSTQISMPTFRRGSYSKLSTMISKQGVTFEYYAIERGWYSYFNTEVGWHTNSNRFSDFITKGCVTFYIHSGTQISMSCSHVAPSAYVISSMLHGWQTTAWSNAQITAPHHCISRCVMLSLYVDDSRCVGR